MTRCLASAFVIRSEMKRCIREEHDDTTDHVWVEATNAAGTALVVRWYGLSKNPSEKLIARRLL